jgi:aryl-alcohol dehydrogenase-like predicted oxidoreductase
MLPTEPFGRTAHLSSRTLFGAAALSNATPAQAEQTLELLLAHGVNHIDTANSYGQSERLLGPALERHRHRFFLATKTGDRTYAGAREHLRRSLELLRTDHIDLWQLHCLVDDPEWETVMGPGGALEALVEARAQGLVRFLGVTGHGVQTPAMHRRSLERFDFDSVLLPYSYPMMQNSRYAAEFEALLALCQARGVAVQTIKSICRAPWNGRPQTHATWYEPFTLQADIDAAVHWVLSRPGLFLNTAGDLSLLPAILDAASRFDPAAADPAALTALVAAQAAQPLFTE